VGISVNLQGVKTELEQLPKGRYLCNVYAIEKKANNKGDGFYIQWTLKVSADHPDEDYTGRTLYYITSLKQDALWNLKRTLIALGDEPDDLDQELDIEPEDYLGRQCVADCKTEMYQGEPKTRVSRILPEDAPLEEGTSVDAALAEGLL
jgi:hypothetical protein